MKAARELVEDLKNRLIDRETCVRESEVAAWQEERHRLEMTMQELRENITESNRNVVELQRQLEFEMSERDKIQHQLEFERSERDKIRLQRGEASERR